MPDIYSWESYIMTSFPILIFWLTYIDFCALPLNLQHIKTWYFYMGICMLGNSPHSCAYKSIPYFASDVWLGPKCVGLSHMVSLLFSFSVTALWIFQMDFICLLMWLFPGFEIKKYEINIWFGFYLYPVCLVLFFYHSLGLHPEMSPPSTLQPLLGS